MKRRYTPKKYQYHPTVYFLVFCGLAAVLFSGYCQIMEPQTVQPTPREISEDAFILLNGFREDNGQGRINWDERAYQLAEARIADMHEYDYYDHVNPQTKEEANTLAPKFNLPANLGENLLMTTGSIADADYIISGWRMSPKHRENMLYDYSRGAIACDEEYAVFIGVV